jgi:hypothetical protein
MAERREKVYEFVKQELSKNSEVGSRDLFERAKQLDRAVASDSMQQFHARYFLPARREVNPGGGGGGRAARGRQTAARARRGRRGAGAATGEAAPPAKQRDGAARRGRKAAGSAEGVNRDEVRALLLKFAQELTDAESRSGLVKVLGRVDDYVNRIASVGR